MGFWAVFSLVTGSQIGSGMFMLPVSIAPYGVYGLWGWLISAMGSIALALVFAELCAKLPYTGGPHIYVQEAFGKDAAFFVGWTYWLVSWVSTSALVIACLRYMTPFTGNLSSFAGFWVEVLILVSVVLVNMWDLKTIGKIEFILSSLKIIPLAIIPIFAISRFDGANIVIDSSLDSTKLPQLLGAVTLLTLWGFIGLEAGTTPAGSVTNPKKTIPRAVITGTICVAVLYFVNSLSIMGLINGKELTNSVAPYVDAARIMFGGEWYLLISVIAVTVCLSSLNSWTLASGQIALGLAECGLVPTILARKNKHGAPFINILVSAAGIIILLYVTSHGTVATQITSIIDFSVVAFLFVYLFCVLSLIKILMTTKSRISAGLMLSILVALLFCLCVIYETPVESLLIATLFTLSGLPVYLYQKFSKSL
jgi:APA family basic amino acid/polyamine antiporter